MFWLARLYLFPRLASRAAVNAWRDLGWGRGWRQFDLGAWLFFYAKMLQADVFCTFRSVRLAWFHMVRGLEATGALPVIRGQDTSRIEYSAVGCLYGLCRHGTCARRPGRNV